MMIAQCISQLRTAVLLTLIFILLTGLIYPSFITGLSQALFYSKANGSLITQGDKLVGSSLIGQEFKDPKFFWGRPSATTPNPYDSSNSNASNLGPSNPDLVKNVKARVEVYQNHPHNSNQSIPVDLVTSSASGLDPEISLEGALFQVPRIAKARGLKESEVIDLIHQHVINPTWGLWGPHRVNVVELNLALEAQHG